jgi:hypothetical protein
MNKTVFQNGVNKAQFLYKEIPFHIWLWNRIFDVERYFLHL